ncbi:MAG: CPBP family intramembrane metalloprotease [Lachnospiraceae bacterium]|nr:CPBP family intramembrane metalloprotease [Lachnospiraceae bacterium]
MNTSDSKNKKDIFKWGLSLTLGTMVVLWRVVFTTRMEITINTVILVMTLDLLLTLTLIFINRHELKEAFSRKIVKKDFLILGLWFIIYLAVSVLAELINGFLSLPYAPAAWVSGEFNTIFPLGMVVCGVLTAPVWEEIAFRMAGRNLFKNKFLFVFITTFLFTFIHTGLALKTGLGYVAVGVVLAVMYLKTKDIRMVIAIHFVTNCIGILPNFFYSLFNG